jgi:hypothetical protein
MVRPLWRTHSCVPRSHSCERNFPNYDVIARIAPHSTIPPPDALGFLINHTTGAAITNRTDATKNPSRSLTPSPLDLPIQNSNRL